MKTGIVLCAALVLIALCGCATDLPTPTYAASDPTWDIEYKGSKTLLDNTGKLSVEQKALGTTMLMAYYQYKHAIDDYSIKLANVDAENKKKDSQYSLTNGLVGALGGISAIKIAVGYGYITSLWTAIGLTIQKGSVEQAITDAATKRADLDKLATEMMQLRDPFWQMVTAADAPTATKQFESWRTQMHQVLDHASKILSVTPVVPAIK